MEQTKVDLTLSDGKEITFDFNAISIREWRALYDVKQSEEDEYRIIGKMIGYDAEIVAEFRFQDWVQIIKSMRTKARELNVNPT